MKYYRIRLGAAGSANQSQVMDKIKSSGADVIQISDGLIAKSTSPLDEILSEYAQEMTIEDADPSDETLSKDAKLFMGSPA